MKTLNLIPRALSLGLSLGLMASCAQDNGWKSSDAGAAAVTDTGRSTPNLDDTLSPQGSDYFSSYPGASVQFTPDSLATFNKYVATHPLNNPTDFRVYMDFNDVGNGRWAGDVVIAYRDNGQIYSGNFSTTNPSGYQKNRVSYKDWYKNKPNAEFNQWFNFDDGSGPKQVFHGFFQDQYGAIVVVIDESLDLGDGGGAHEFSGSIWFKNFKLAPAPQYMGSHGEQCWFLLPPSPYECGTFKVGGNDSKIVTTSALYPTNGYQRLGTFQGVKAAKAFRN